jgi:lysophospholipase L1-like esterase
MSARGRFLSGLVTVVVALAGFVGLGALPAAASPPIIQYVALGDSYAAGSALGRFPNCDHGDGGYPVQLLELGSRIDLQTNDACSGATTFDVVENQLSALNSDTRLVTLTVGAANLELSLVLTACTTGTPQACLAEIARARGDMEELGINLPLLYAAVAGAAPRARIVVTGYPHLFEPVNSLFTQINDAIDDLNSTIEQAVSDANDADVNIHYVDVVAEFAGHGIVSPITTPGAFIYSLFSVNGQPETQAFHPTPAGYRAYADAISAALPGGWLDKQKQSA